MTLERTSLPFFTIATEVSSQLDSIPHYYYIFIFHFHFLFIYFISIVYNKYYNPKILVAKLNIPLETALITGVIIIPAIPVIHITTKII